jgi:hypothetical protein
MRSVLLLTGLVLAAAPALAAETADVSAGLFAERTALLAIDDKCALLARPVRAALTATTIQARRGALREGWSDARLDGVSQRAGEAGRDRACDDPIVLAAAKRAEAGYEGWARTQAIDLPGAARTWRVRRTPDPAGWILVQDVGAARFGLRRVGDRDELVLVAPLTASAPGSAQLYMRDRARTARPFLNVPGLAPSRGLAAAAVPHGMAASWIASARRVERDKNGASRLVFVFPISLLNEMGALDPRESAEIDLMQDRALAQRLYIEIGDLAVARAFLDAAPIG